MLAFINYPSVKSEQYICHSFELLCKQKVFLSCDFVENKVSVLPYNYLLLCRYQKKTVWLRLNCLWFMQFSKMRGSYWHDKDVNFNLHLLFEILRDNFNLKELLAFAKQNRDSLFDYGSVQFARALTGGNDFGVVRDDKEVFEMTLLNKS